MMQRDSGTFGPEHPSAGSTAQQEKVVDFVAWRRARPRPLTNDRLTDERSADERRANAGPTNERPANAGSAEIVSISQQRAQREMAGMLPAFDYAGHQRPASRRSGSGPTPSGMTPSGATRPGSIGAGLTPSALSSIAATAPNAATLSAVLALLSAPMEATSQLRSLETEVGETQPVVTQPVVTEDGVTQHGVTHLAAVRQAAARKSQAQKAQTQNSSASKWSPRRWPSGLAWLVSSMSDGVMDVENLQTILSDMQQELDALDASIHRLRKDEDDDLDIELTRDLDDGMTSSAQAAGQRQRRSCDMTGRAIAAVAQPDRQDWVI
jgi:hypothetical protein